MRSASNGLGWTGGQYSLVRALFGAYLCVHFATLVPWGREVFSSAGVLADGGSSPLLRVFPNLFLISDSPAFVTAVLVAGALLGVLLAAGWHDRVAAVLLWWIWASLFGRNPLISNPSLPYVGLLLLVHAGTPRAPYGAWSARGRADPGGGWCMPLALYRVLWILMSVGYTYSGLAKLSSPSWRDGSAVQRVLANPLSRPGGLGALLAQMPDALLRVATWGALGFEIAFVALALSRRLRPLAWGAMLGMHLVLILLIDFADLSLGMVILHLFTFDPHWLRARPARRPETVFYDGECGLCHRTVRFVLAEDPEGRAFRFAPLFGPTHETALPNPEHPAGNDTIVVLGADGVVRRRSTAIAHMLVTLGGYWALLGMVLRIVPRALRDAAYDGVAAIRGRLFARPTEACPLVPPELGARFDP